jgi:hypothetical protein
VVFLVVASAKNRVWIIKKEGECLQGFKKSRNFAATIFNKEED